MSWEHMATVNMVSNSIVWRLQGHNIGDEGIADHVESML